MSVHPSRNVCFVSIILSFRVTTLSFWDHHGDNSFNARYHEANLILVYYNGHGHSQSGDYCESAISVRAKLIQLLLESGLLVEFWTQCWARIQFNLNMVKQFSTFLFILFASYVFYYLLYKKVPKLEMNSNWNSLG